jgi:PAS domain S-box-containing protein
MESTDQPVIYSGAQCSRLQRLAEMEALQVGEMRPSMSSAVTDLGVEMTVNAIPDSAGHVSRLENDMGVGSTEEARRASETRFRQMFHVHSAVLLVIDSTTGDIVDANEAAACFYGRPISELKAMNIRQINDLPWEKVQDRMASAVAVPNAHFEFRHRLADGSMREVEVYSNGIEVAGHAYLYSIIHDISDRVRAEQLQHATYDRLQRAEEFARFGHWEYSLDDRIIHASEGASRIYGFLAPDIPLDDIRNCALAEFRPILDEALRDLVEHNLPFDQEFKIHRISDGEIVHVHSKAEYDVHTNKIFGVVQDITGRKRVEEERERLIVELRQALEQVKTLSGIVPICSYCKKIRDDRGYWEQVEAYVSKHTEAQFSHGICPQCLEHFCPEESPTAT